MLSLAALLLAPDGPGSLPPAPKRASLTLSWSAPEGCPSAEDVEGVYEDLVGLGIDKVLVDANATVLVVQDRWTLTLELRVDGELEHRELEAASCDDLARVTALLAAIASDPISVATIAFSTDSSLAQVPEPPLPEPEPEAEPEDLGTGVVGVVVEEREAVTPRSRLRRVWSVGVFAGVSWGAQPGVPAQVGIKAGIAVPQFRGEVLARYTTPTTASYADAPRVAARFDAWTVSGRGCPAPRVGAVTFPLCFGLSTGVLIGAGSGFEGAQTDRAWWIAAVAAPGVRWNITRRFVLAFAFDLELPLRERAFRIDRHQPEPQPNVHNTGSVVLLPWAGIEVDFL